MKSKSLAGTLLSGILLFNLGCGRSTGAEEARLTPQVSLQNIPDLQTVTFTPTSNSGSATPSLQITVENTTPAVKTAPPVQLRPGQGLPLPGTLVPGALDQLSQEDATLALEAYARDIFGISINLSLGRSGVGDLNLPLSIESGVATALELAEISYFGLLPGGAAALSLGSGTSNNDLTARIQKASLAILSFRLTQAVPADGEAALAIIQTKFPGLVGQSLSLQSDQDGYFFSTGQAQNWALRGGTITLKNSLILAGISPGRQSGEINAWAVVACGLLAVPFLH